MPSYELYTHAGNITYAQWKNEGIQVPVFDKDGTLTSYRSHELDDEVIEGMKHQEFPDIFPNVVLISNNHCADNVRYSGKQLENSLGVSVLVFCQAEGYRRKPHPNMGLVAARELGVNPSEMAVIGDRWYCDVRFGRNMGAGKVALCQKVGSGDRLGMPALRCIEAGAVALERRLGRAGRLLA